MKKFLNRLIAVSYMAVMFLAPVGLATATVSAAVSTDPDIHGSLCAGGNLDVTNPDCSEADASPQKVNDLIGTVINIFSILVGVVSVLMIIFGGFKYITSGGNETNVTGAKNTILFAIVGLVIVALAQLIVRFVLNKANSL